ncbi:MAG: hypothetical protein KC620_10650 [Myxococcales bacterium]|nr:hypothetical protein [Myxococcales bacterium]
MNTASDPIAAARAALLRTRLWPAVLGVLASAAVFTLALRGAASWVDLSCPWPVAGGLGLLLFGLAEVRVQRASRRRRAPGVALLLAMMRKLGPAAGVEVGLRRGLPYLRARQGETAFVVHFEPLRGDRLRVALTLDEESVLNLRLVSRLREGFPDRWLARVRAREADVPGVPESICAISPDPDCAAAFWADDESFRSAATRLLTFNAPVAAVLDLQGDGIGWDTLLTERVDAHRLLSLVPQLATLAVRARLWSHARPVR